MPKLPPGACDAHLHVIPEAEATALPRYRAVQATLGLSRAVLVQAKVHGTNHAAILAAVAALGPGARGIGVLPLDVPDAELERLHHGGIRGLRFSLWNPNDAVARLDWLEPLAARIAPLGWHAQIHMMGDQIAEHATLLHRLPCPIVFDHMGRLPPRQGPNHPAFAVIAGLLDAGRAWVKLAGAYLNTGTGTPGYADATRIARAFVRAAPERLVWGSDWPHVTEPDGMDDAELLALLSDWAGDTAMRDRILVDNPAELYGFGSDAP